MLGCGEGFRPGAFPDRFGTCRGDLTLLVPHETERNAHKEGAFHTPLKFTSLRRSRIQVLRQRKTTKKRHSSFRCWRFTSG
jgi:hypothetical protein